MQLNEAIQKRLEDLMKQKNLSKYEVSYNAGINPSILNDFFRCRTLYPRIDTLYLICLGIGITLNDFFDDPIFNEENIEIRDSNN